MIKSISLKYRLSIAGGFLVPLFGRVALNGTGHEDELFRYLVPCFIGSMAGYLIGRAKMRWHDKRNELQHALSDLREQIMVGERLDKELQQNESYLKAILSNANMLIFIVDENHHFILINPMFSKFHDCSPEDLVGTSGVHSIASKTLKKWQAGQERVKENREPVSFEEVYTTTPKPRTFLTTLFPLKSEKSAFCGICGISIDISYQKDTEEELAAERSQLSVTLDSIADGVLATDAHGNIVLFNRVAESITGWQSEEALGKTICSIFTLKHAEGALDCSTLIADILNGIDKTSVTKKSILLNHNDTEIPISWTCAPKSDPSGKITGIVTVFRDISVEEKTERELQKIKRLETVGLLAGGIAHDFNNVLLAILGNISLAKQRGIKNLPVQDQLLNAERASRQAQNLTKQLLTFSKGGEPVKEIADIGVLLEDASKMALAGSRISLNLNLAPKLWSVELDKGQVIQVFQNILINAKQAMPTGGTINLSAHNISNDECCLKLGENHDKGCVRIVVEDFGRGISQENLNHIFDPFFTTKKSGSGLGLAICHSIIRKHDGHIFVQSKESKGTTFEIFLPASGAVPDAQKKFPKFSVSKDQKILVMDDDANIRDVAVQMINHLGFQVDTVTCGEDAIARYREQLTKKRAYDLVILDLTIPAGMGGKEAVVEILKIDQDATIIVSSGYSNDPAVARFRDFGFKGSLAKPFDINDLERMIQTALNPALSNIQRRGYDPR